MIAIDNGSNSDYTADGGASFPIMQAAEPTSTDPDNPEPKPHSLGLEQRADDKA